MSVGKPVVEAREIYAKLLTISCMAMERPHLEKNADEGVDFGLYKSQLTGWNINGYRLDGYDWGY